VRLICVLDDKLVSELSEEAEKAFFQRIAISLSNETVQTTGTVLLAGGHVETVDGRQIFCRLDGSKFGFMTSSRWWPKTVGHQDPKLTRPRADGVIRFGRSKVR